MMIQFTQEMVKRSAFPTAAENLTKRQIQDDLWLQIVNS